MIEAPVDSGYGAVYRGLLQTVGGAIDARLKPTDPQTGTLWYSLGDGTTAILTTEFLEGPISFPFLITGWVLLSRGNGAIVLSVRRTSYDNYPSFVSITGTAPPTLVNRKARSDEVPGWTTQIEADDILAIGVTSNVGALTKVSLGLRYRKQGSRPG